MKHNLFLTNATNYCDYVALPALNSSWRIETTLRMTITDPVKKMISRQMPLQKHDKNTIITPSQRNVKWIVLSYN